MSEIKQGPILSVVDYDAWRKGYMPPSEHILIDKLSYRGARVIMSNWLGGDAQLWVVLEGAQALTAKQRRALLELMRLWFEAEDGPSEPIGGETTQNANGRVIANASGCS